MLISYLQIDGAEQECATYHLASYDLIPRIPTVQSDSALDTG